MAGVQRAPGASQRPDRPVLSDGDRAGDGGRRRPLDRHWLVGAGRGGSVQLGFIRPGRTTRRPLLPPPAAPGADPTQVAIAWLQAYRTLRYDEPVDAWVDRVRPVVTPGLAATDEHGRAAGPGQDWQRWVALRWRRRGRRGPRARRADVWPGRQRVGEQPARTGPVRATTGLPTRATVHRPHAHLSTRSGKPVASPPEVACRRRSRPQAVAGKEEQGPSACRRPTAGDRRTARPGDASSTPPSGPGRRSRPGSRPPQRMQAPVCAQSSGSIGDIGVRKIVGTGFGKIADTTLEVMLAGGPPPGYRVRARSQQKRRRDR